MAQAYSQLITRSRFNKRYLLLVVSLSLLLIFNGCKTDIAVSEEEITTDNINHEEESDYSWDSSNVTQIALNGSSIKITGTGASASGSKATISAAGNYNVTGSLTNGQIIVNTTDKGVVRLILNGVSISCTTGVPVYIMDAGKTVINLADNTENFLADGTTYATVDGEPNAAIFCKSNLTIFGGGKLTVRGNYLDGISSKDGLILKSGNISVSAVDDAIRGKDYLMIKSGTISVTSGGDGLKSDNELSSAMGFVTITTGTITVTSGGDAIAAQTEIKISDGTFNLTSGGGSSKTKTTLSAKGIKALVGLSVEKGTFTVSSADDALHTNGTMTINGGTFTLSSSDDGLHADAAVTVNNAGITVLKSTEGIESHIITVKDANISLTSTDDSFNATSGSRTEQDDKSYLNIYGGNIYLNASGGDPLDSNGSIVMTGGNVVVHGPASSPEVAIDYNGSFNLSGGVLVASGTNSNMTQAPSTTSSQKSVLVMFKSSLAADAIFRLEDSSGNELVTFKPARRFQSMVYSSPRLIQGSTYKIFTGGSSTGTVSNGIVTGGTYTGGTLYATFTISSVVTRVN